MPGPVRLAGGDMVVKYMVTEAQFGSFVEAALRQFGWRFCHYRTSIDPRRKGAWRTAMTGDKGLPDYIAVRPPRLLFIEIKGSSGRLELEQKAWIEALKEIGAFDRLTFRDIPEVYVWWPRDHEQVIETLR